MQSQMLSAGSNIGTSCSFGPACAMQGTVGSVQLLQNSAYESGSTTQCVQCVHLKQAMQHCYSGLHESKCVQPSGVHRTSIRMRQLDA